MKEVDYIDAILIDSKTIVVMIGTGEERRERFRIVIWKYFDSFFFEFLLFFQINLP